MLKKNKLRYNEYYDMQHIYDELYAQSKNGNNFYKLLEIIGSEQNICLAYRNLKSNSGSKTAGTDGMTIDDIKQLSNAEIVATVRESLSNYRPKSVRRVFIPKAGSDKMRPLGIPCIWDRLVQQCILQVLEPMPNGDFLAGGVRIGVESGLITSIPENSVANGTFEVISGLSWANGGITSVDWVKVNVSNGAIKSWSTRTQNF